MSTRHIVRIAPLHTSILLTLIYCLVAAIVVVFGAVLMAFFGEHNESLLAVLSREADVLLAGALLNIAVAFIISMLISLVYNFLAKYLGGIEITLDDD